MKARLFSYFFKATKKKIILNLLVPILCASTLLRRSITTNSKGFIVIAIFLIFLSVFVAIVRYKLSNREETQRDGSSVSDESNN